MMPYSEITELLNKVNETPNEKYLNEIVGGPDDGYVYENKVDGAYRDPIDSTKMQQKLVDGVWRDVMDLTDFFDAERMKRLKDDPYVYEYGDDGEYRYNINTERGERRKNAKSPWIMIIDASGKRVVSDRKSGEPDGVGSQPQQ